MKKILISLLTILSGSIYVKAGDYADIKFGPWITEITETGFTVLWTSSQKDFSWVEIAPDDNTPFEICERQKFYYVISGRRIADTFHRVRVSGLEPGKAYRYRIYGKTVQDDSNAYAVDYGAAKRVKFKGDAIIRTIDRNADSCKFIMLNDIHGKDDNFKALTEDVKPNDIDFFVMNGDMVSYISSAEEMMKHTFAVVPQLTSSTPTIYTRGNHETRGKEAHLLSKLCPTSTGEPYYMFRHGPVAFLILDSGEDKPDNASEYSGTVEFDAFRSTELEWIKDAVKDPIFTEAPFKVAVMHIPALKFETSWYSQLWLNEYLVPVLNEAGVDIMLSGHHHKHLFIPAGECGNDFPILANDDTDRLDFKADARHITIRTSDLTGKETHSYTINKAYTAAEKITNCTKE